MSGCPWPPRGARTIHDLKQEAIGHGSLKRRGSVSRRAAAGMSVTADGLLGRVLGTAQSSESDGGGPGADAMGSRAPGEIARGSAGRKQVLSAMYSKVERQLTGGIGV